ncbi:MULTISPECIES: hypothetical protein [unclassified Variovorax]|jgi:hypothetical protein|uniref:hypothetical protein n=1 Tax=unclassified Variovorax TaxID=663243 RepID=UPI002B2367DF|nr:MULTISPECIES: hypothetical protein [unclassified Variovorax]MEB0057640.1 hypothetical protein [Variovorax sp. LG9.2]MEB0113437.1 hypothetical protein [Variovorax sp. RTB1]
MNRQHVRKGLSFIVALGAIAAPSAWAQSADASAQERYQRALTVCNDGSLPAPERNGCVRMAGRQLDRTNGGPPVNMPTTTPDGRATVVAPVGSTPPNDDDTTTSRDGRATIVAPSDGTATPR